MLWNNLPDVVKSEIEALPTVAEQAEAWLMLHRGLQIRASLDEEMRIFIVACADAAKAIEGFAVALDAGREAS